MDIASGTRLDFLEALRQMVRARSSGSVYLKVDDNRAALLSLRTGQVVGLRFGPLIGARALELFKLTRQMSWRLEEGPVAMVHPDLGATDDILRELLGEPSATSRPALSVAMQDALGQALVDYTGPVAAMVLADALERVGEVRGAEDGRRLIAVLAEEIGAPAEAAEFAARAREILRIDS